MAFGVETVGKVAFTCGIGFALNPCLHSDQRLLV